MNINRYLAMATHSKNGYWYRFMVKMITDAGTERPIIAWVEGIPYSRAHFVSNWTTGGMEGRGQRIISFIPCPWNRDLINNKSSIHFSFRWCIWTCTYAILTMCLPVQYTWPGSTQEWPSYPQHHQYSRTRSWRRRRRSFRHPAGCQDETKDTKNNL